VSSDDDDALREKVLDSFKVVCICNKIKKGTIEKAIARGARSLGDIKRATRAGTGPCGAKRGGVTRCTPVVREMLERAKRRDDVDSSGGTQ
jgi:NAD(P)H-nitrite reductase large subunit